jgi:hypothetical protein
MGGGATTGMATGSVRGADGERARGAGRATRVLRAALPPAPARLRVRRSSRASSTDTSWTQVAPTCTTHQHATSTNVMANSTSRPSTGSGSACGLWACHSARAAAVRLPTVCVT